MQYLIIDQISLNQPMHSGLHCTLLVLVVGSSAANLLSETVFEWPFQLVRRWLMQKTFARTDVTEGYKNIEEEVLETKPVAERPHNEMKP